MPGLGRLCFAARDATNGGDFVYALASDAKVDPQHRSGPINEVSHAILHADGDYEVFRLVLLQQDPLRAGIVFGMAPVAQLPM